MPFWNDRDVIPICGCSMIRLYPVVSVDMTCGDDFMKAQPEVLFSNELREMRDSRLSQADLHIVL